MRGYFFVWKLNWLRGHPSSVKLLRSFPGCQEQQTFFTYFLPRGFCCEHGRPGCTVIGKSYLEVSKPLRSRLLPL